MRTRRLYDVVALLARLGVGVVFIAHGWQKIQVGVASTAHTFDHLGMPVPTAAAVYTTFVELLGGAALILGLGLPVAGTLLFVDMLGALVFVNAKHGLFVVDQDMAKQGFELVLVLGLASLLLAAGAGGRLTLDSQIFPRRTTPATGGQPPSISAPEPPASTPTAATSPAPTAEEPRVAADIVDDTSRDTLVAGRKWPRKPADGPT
jgi:putative oxidoreductase